jgi:hypothetical protein
MIKVFDIVALVKDLPEAGLRRGQIGTVIEAITPSLFEVEFSDVSGRTYSMRALHSNQLLALPYEIPQLVH